MPTVSTPATLSGIGGIVITDFDGINGNDIVVSSYSNDTIMFYANDGLGGFAAGVAISTNADGAGQLTAVDINKDGNLDISIAEYDGNTTSWVPGNGDGDLDVASIGFFSNSVFWYENLLETLNVEDNNLELTKIFPNPTEDLLNFNGFRTQSIEITIYDILEKRVLMRTHNPNDSLNVSDLANGLYTLNINGEFAAKFFKE